MLLRSPASSFVPSSYVFPGGGLDEADADRHIFATWAPPAADQVIAVAEKTGSEERGHCDEPRTPDADRQADADPKARA